MRTKTKFTDSRLECMGYPVGECIIRNIPTIKIYTEIIKKESNGQRINLYCAGSSGAIIAAIIATELSDVEICHVKKEGENSHSPSCPYSRGYNVIVDDFVSTGRTIDYILDKYQGRIKSFDLMIVTSNISNYRCHTFTRRTRSPHIKKVYCQS